MHEEKHSKLGPFMRDSIIGVSDGLTVPFAIAAGLASAAATTSTIIVAAVLAEIAAGSISMGLGGFLATQTEADQYDAERRREESEIDEKTEIEKEETRTIFQSYGLSLAESNAIIETLSKRKQDWADFMMQFELGLAKPDRTQARRSAFTIGIAYAVGGFIPLAPYLFIQNVSSALIASVVLTLIALALFGYLRGKVVSQRPWRSVLETLFVGGLAAGVAFFIARLVA